MQLSIDFADVPQMSYEEWGEALRIYPWGSQKAVEPKSFTFWKTTLSVYGLKLGAIKHQCRVAAPGGARSVKREYEDVRLDGVDHYHVVFQIAGSTTVIQNDQVAELAPGDAVLIDAARPSHFASNGGVKLDLVLPRQLMMSHLGLELQGGLRSPRGTPAGRALHQLILDADEAGDSMSAWANHQMQRAVYDLVGALFEPKFDPVSVSLHTDKLFARICSIIKDRFADPDFGPSEVAAEAGISLRYLSKLFAARGLSCTRFIHSLRLEHAARLLHRRSSVGTGQPLSEIAYACGFKDYRHFSRKFHGRFGHAPSANAGDP